MDVPYGLSREDFERMARSVRKTEGLPPRRDGQLRRPSGGMDAPHNWVVITSASAQTVTLSADPLQTIQCFSAVWSYFDSSGSGWVDTLNAAWYLGANGEIPIVGKRYECRSIGQDVDGIPIWSSDGDQSLEWVRPGSSNPSQVYLGRKITDGILANGSNVLESPSQGQFTSADIGVTLIGSGIPNGATVASVTDAETLVMSVNATADGTNVAVTIRTGSVKAYSASITVQNQRTGTWADVLAVWLEEANDSAWSALVGGSEPVSVPVEPGTIYQCRYFATDENGVQIWTVAEKSPETCSTVTLGPFVTGFSCDAQGNTSYNAQYLCIPNGDICNAFISDDPSGCSGESPPPPPPPPPPPLSPPVLGDVFFFGNFW